MKLSAAPAVAFSALLAVTFGSGVWLSAAAQDFPAARFHVSHIVETMAVTLSSQPVHQGQVPAALSMREQRLTNAVVGVLQRYGFMNVAVAVEETRVRLIGFVPSVNERAMLVLAVGAIEGVASVDSATLWVTELLSDSAEQGAISHP